MNEENEFERLSPSQVVPVRGVKSFEFDGTKLAMTGYAFISDHLETNPNKVEHSLVVMKRVPETEIQQVTQQDGSLKEEEVNTGRDMLAPVFVLPTQPVREEIPILEFAADKPNDSRFANSEEVVSAIKFLKLDSETNGIEHTFEISDLTEQLEAWKAYELSSKYSDIYTYSLSVDFGTIQQGDPLEPGEYQLFIRIKQFINGRWVADEFSIGQIENSESDVVYTTKMRKYAAKKVTSYSFVAKQSFGEDTLVMRSTKLAAVNPASLIVRDEVIGNEPKNISKFKKAVFHLGYSFFKKFLPIKKNSISFLSDSRIDLTGNFEYIYNEIQRRESDFDTHFYFKLTNNEPKTIREYLGLAKAIATSKYVLLDDFYPLVYPLDIRNGVELIQVWHAVGAFKTFGFSRVGMKGGPKLKSRNHRNYTRALVSSHNVAPNYAEGFGIDQNRIMPLGAPRTDMFFNEEQKSGIIESLYEQMPFLKGKKVILFAPTFRGPGQQTAYYPFDWVDYQELYEAFADKGFVFLFKIHPFVKNSPSIPYEYSDFFYDVSDYREVNDLLLLTDVMITDYSSVVFEYSLLKRKTIFFAPDLSDYMSSRNFYVDYLDFIPGPHVVDTKHLVEEIETFDQVDNEKLEAFLNYYFEDLDGKASERFVDVLEAGFEDAETGHKDQTKQFSEDGKWIPDWGGK